MVLISLEGRKLRTNLYRSASKKTRLVESRVIPWHDLEVASSTNIGGN
jgi:hypothetical protein